MAFHGGAVVTLALTYGAGVDWLANLRAAGGGRMHLRDELLVLGAPARPLEHRRTRPYAAAAAIVAAAAGCDACVELPVLEVPVAGMVMTFAARDPRGSVSPLAVGAPVEPAPAISLSLHGLAAARTRLARALVDRESPLEVPPEALTGRVRLMAPDRSIRDHQLASSM